MAGNRFTSATATVGRIPVRLGASVFRGDIDGMIAWAPDYRFVWSPRNVDVRRRGVEASAGIESGGVLRSLRALRVPRRQVHAERFSLAS